MAIRWYRPKAGGTKLELYIDPEEYDQAEEQTALAEIQELQGLGDANRTLVATALGHDNLGGFDDWLQARAEELQDRLDYYDYQNRDETVTVRDGAWFTPEAVEAHSGEEVGNEAVNMIDGDNGTWWQSNLDQTHVIDLRLRSYKKRISNMQIRRGGNVRSQLQNLEIRAANSLGGLNNDGNIIASGVELLTEADWNEIAISKKTCRYIRLSFTSAHASNEARIREIEVWVETKDPLE